MLFDTHAHMDDRAFDCDREALLTAFPQQGIQLLMNPGCSLSSSRNASALSRQYVYIYAAVGSHPDVADEVNEAVLDEYRQLCKMSQLGLQYRKELENGGVRLGLALDLGAEKDVLQNVVEKAAAEDLMKLKGALEEKFNQQMPVVTQLGGCGGWDEEIESGFLI